MWSKLLETGMDESLIREYNHKKQMVSKRTVKLYDSLF